MGSFKIAQYARSIFVNNFRKRYNCKNTTPELTDELAKSIETIFLLPVQRLNFSISSSNCLSIKFRTKQESYLYFNDICVCVYSVARIGGIMGSEPPQPRKKSRVYFTLYFIRSVCIHTGFTKVMFS